jgi:hypothetical protein
VPLVAHKTWRHRPGRAVLEGWVDDDRFAAANVGLLAGLSGVTIVDVDALTDLEWLIRLFGKTPLIAETPSGGRHLWYRARGERCADLRTKGYCADVRGIGGFIVVPPSVRPSGAHAGVQYRFLSGGLETLADLPGIREEAAEVFGLRKTDRVRRPAEEEVSSRLLPGQRNSAMFRQCLRLARGCECDRELIDEALALNRIACDSPLEEAEVRRFAQSAWSYQQQGRNFSGTRGFGCTADLRARIGEPDAFWLFSELILAHPDAPSSGREFAISAAAMAKHGAAKPLSEGRIRAARTHLLEIGVLVEVHRGGAGRRDPSRFRFGNLERLARC